MNNTITREKMIDHLNDQVGLNKREAKELLVSFFKAIENELILGNKVNLVGFGVFYPLDKKPRIGRNLHNMKPVVISKRRVVRFRASNSLKQKLSFHNQYAEQLCNEDTQINKFNEQVLCVK